MSSTSRRIRVKLSDDRGAGFEFALSRAQVYGLGLSTVVLVLGVVVIGSTFITPEESRLVDLRRIDPVRTAVPTDELDRIRQYENELRERAQSIDAIIQDAKSREAAPAKGVGANGKKKRFSLGLGGGRESRSPVITYRGNSREKSSRQKGRDSAWQKMKGEISRLRDYTRVKTVKLDPEQDLVRYLDHQAETLRSFPFGLPVHDATISSAFGARVSPFSGRWQFHQGLDLAQDKYSPVYATADGTVVVSDYASGYGLAVMIDHGGQYETLYGHLAKSVVKEGDKVCRGMQIGMVGSTGNSTGPHVHYEVRFAGESHDPLKFMAAGDHLALVAKNDEAARINSEDAVVPF